MRIAFISREYPPETGWGGIGTYVYHLSRALAAAGHDVHVVCRSASLEESMRCEGTLTIHRIRERKLGGPFADLRYHWLPVSEWFYSQRVAEKIRQLHEQAAFDIIEAPEYRAEAFHLVRRPPAPVVLKLHTPTYLIREMGSLPTEFREWLMDRMEYATARRAAAISAPSVAVADLAARDWGLPRQAIAHIPNPVNPALKEPVPWPSPEAPPTVLFVGRVDFRKGIGVLARAMSGVLKAVPEAHFILVGAPEDKTVLGGDRSLYQEILEEWRTAGVMDRVQLVPWQKDPTALRPYYAQSHIIVVPSLYENFPNVVLEGMAAGRAVVASATGGIPEIIISGVEGKLVLLGDVGALERAILGLVHDLPRARRMGEAARAGVFKRYGASRIATMTAEWYARMLGTHARTRRPVRALAIVTERWIDWAKDEGMAIVMPEFLRGLERDGMVTRLIRRPYAPKRPASWGRSGVSASLREVLEITWDLTEPLRNLGMVLRKWLLRPSKFDLLWEHYGLYGLSGWTLSWLTARPLVFNVDAPLIEEYEQLQSMRLGLVRRTFARWILRANLARAAAVHVPALPLAEWLVRDYHVPRPKLHVIPNGVHLDTFRSRENPQLVRQRYALGDKPVAMFLGSLQPWHGCDVLLEAFARARQRCSEAQLLIVGDGKMRPALTQQTATLALDGSVQFIGQVPHARVPELLAAADVAVLPYPPLSMPFYFSPIKLFEYMGAGKAIIASRIGQIEQVLRDGETARLVSPGSVDELAGALVELFTSPERRALLGAKAREASEAYTWERQGDALARICRSVVERRDG